jgi:hypothetical protein
MSFIIANWAYILLTFFIAEKIVKLTPTPIDDIVIDLIIKNVWKGMLKTFDGMKYLYTSFFPNKIKEIAEDASE